MAQALTLQLPSWEVLSQELKPIDPEAVHVALSSARLELATEFGEQLAELYKQLTLPAGSEETLDAAAVARRRLRNVLLRLLSVRGDREAAERAYLHFKNAGCMTDRYAALISLADMEHPEREKAFQEFFEEAKGAQEHLLLFLLLLHLLLLLLLLWQHGVCLLVCR